MALHLTKDGAERLAFAIIRRAYEDYYTSFLPPRLPKRPKIKKMVNGRWVRSIATDHEYHMWLVDKLQRMIKRRNEIEYFIWSTWYDTLVDMEPDGKTERVNKILNELEYRRKNGLQMFGDGETEGFEDGYSGFDSW